MKLELGKQGEDRLTGFKGTITAICHYITGCDRILLVPKIKKDNSMIEPEWFDDVRIVTKKGSVFSLPKKNNGADIDAPLS